MIGVKLTLMGCAVMIAATLLGQATNAPQQDQSHKTSHQARPVVENRGQQVFDQNCARCHNSPEGFSSNISATIAKHMRVRAGLSDADYKALLHFLNP
ncbi:MAG: cytochrome c [Terracidiphilus sp.]|jgi:cytochrome c5